MNDMTKAEVEKLDLENPLGVDGFEFVEFTGPEPKAMIARLETMGFTQTHVNPTTDVVRLKQGDISFLVHRSPAAHAADFARDHGPSANGMAFRTTDAKAAYEGAVERGARPAQGGVGGGLQGGRKLVDVGRHAGAQAEVQRNGAGGRHDVTLPGPGNDYGGSAP